jgi:orotidine-5'-phosphate decarboxylase
VGFPDRLAACVAERQSQLVLGLDPDPARLWPAAYEQATSTGDQLDGPAERAARAVRAHCGLVIDAAAAECVAVKLQAACFERLGAAGWAAFTDTAALARAAGLLVIADAKRGDIDVSAAAYAEAFLGETSTPYGPVRGLDADALTVNPLLGADSLAPFITTARARSAGLFVLVRTSNPGAADLQDRRLRDGGSVSEALACLVHRAGEGAAGRSGLTDIGAVVGATAPEHIERLRGLMPASIFLLPGIGVQGGRVDQLAAAWAPGRAAALVAASRAIAFAYERHGGDPAAAAAAEAARLREMAWTLTG